MDLKKNKEIIRRMGELRIGQTVTFISQDAGVPDADGVVTGLSVRASGLEDITLTYEDGFAFDGLTLEDIRV